MAGKRKRSRSQRGKASARPPVEPSNASASAEHTDAGAVQAEVDAFMRHFGPVFLAVEVAGWRQLKAEAARLLAPGADLGPEPRDDDPEVVELRAAFKERLTTREGRDAITRLYELSQQVDRPAQAAALFEGLVSELIAEFAASRGDETREEFAKSARSRRGQKARELADLYRRAEELEARIGAVDQRWSTLLSKRANAFTSAADQAEAQSRLSDHAREGRSGAPVKRGTAFVQAALHRLEPLLREPDGRGVRAGLLGSVFAPVVRAFFEPELDPDPAKAARVLSDRLRKSLRAPPGAHDFGNGRRPCRHCGAAPAEVEPGEVCAAE